jgi:hypothetical protein
VEQPECMRVAPTLCRPTIGALNGGHGPPRRDPFGATEVTESPGTAKLGFRP